MAKQKDGITDLTKVFISAAKKFTDSEYSRLQSVVFSLLHGVNFGYDTLDQKLFNDAQDIKFLHTSGKKLKKIRKVNKKKYKDNIVYIDFSKEGLSDDA